MPGDWLGLDAIATGNHNFGSLALAESEVWEIPIAPINSTLSFLPDTERRFLQVMSRALSEEFAANGYTGTSIDSRFARFLFKLGEKYLRLGYSNRSFLLCMSRGDIGSYLGTTPESISRVIARFKRDRLVTIIGKNVQVHDCVALDALVNGVQVPAEYRALH